MTLGRRGKPRRTGGRGDWDATDSTPPGERDASVAAPRAPLPASKAPLERRTPLEGPGEPLERNTPLERRTPIKPMSDKTIARLPERAAVVRPLVKCVMAWHSPCGGPIDGHEVVRRSKNIEAQYDPLIVVACCRRHHALDANMREAELVGMRVPGWVWDRDGYRAVDEAERVRASHGTHTPYWLLGETLAN